MNLDANEAGYIGQSFATPQGESGVLPIVPEFIQNDPYLKLSDQTDADLSGVEFFSEGDSVSQQCTF